MDETKAKTGRARMDMLDVLRLVAAVAVMFIHVGFRPQPSPDTGELLRFLMRWAVPFFFLLSGYFLRAENGFPVMTVERLRRVLVITIVANLIYLPLLAAVDGISGLGPNLVISGSWFHLWFLSSLVFGMLTLLIPSRLGLSARTVTIATLAFIALAIGLDFFSSVDERYTGVARLCRFAMAGPLMWLGFVLATKRPGSLSTTLAIILVVGGIAISIAETLWFAKIQLSIFERQYSLGSLPIAVGAILWAARLALEPPQVLVKIGRDYSLVIYIIHPIFLKVAALALGRVVSATALPYWQIAIGAVLSIAFAYLIDRYFPVFANLLRGELPDFRRMRASNFKTRA